MGSSGSMDYTLVSGTMYPSVGLLLGDRLRGPNGGRNPIDFGLAPGVTITTPGSLTVEYFQRVYAADAGIGWCYFTKTSIDTNPGKADTTPNGGAAGFVAGSHSVVKILEIY